MKNTVVFGAGQMGAAIARLLAGNHRILCFADNAEAKQGTEVCGIPVLSPEDSLRVEPACYCLGVLDGQRAAAMEAQLRDLGFEGEVFAPHELGLFDARVATMRLLAEGIEAAGVPGEAAEVGVYRGEFARHINSAFRTRPLHLFDTFEGFPARDLAIEEAGAYSRAQAGDFADTNQNTVYETMPYRPQVSMHKGYFPDTFRLHDRTFCFVSLDADLYEPTRAGLEVFWPRLAPGGAIMVHDYNGAQFRGVAHAVDAFLETPAAADAAVFPVCDLHGSLVIRKLK